MIPRLRGRRGRREKEMGTNREIQGREEKRRSGGEERAD